MYQSLEPLLIRAALRPVGDLPPVWPDLAGDPAAVQAWLATVWDGEGVADAVTLASPDLTRQLQRTVAKADADPREVGRVVESVACYLLRMTGRATPFGLFAGVAPATVGATPAASWGRQHRVCQRVDGAWLDGLVTELAASPGLLHRLPVVVNDLVQVRDDRIVLAFQPDPEHPDSPADRDTPPVMVDVSLRRSAVVDAVLRSARTPILVGDLLDKLRDEFPTTSSAATSVSAPGASERRCGAADAVGRLVGLRLLLTPLRPPTTSPEAIAHLLGQLERADADALPEVAEHTRRVRALVRDRDEPPAGRLTDCPATRSIGAVARSLTVDVRLDATVVLPRSLARHAEQAAAVLTRLSPNPAGAASWNAYHGAFLERYGIGAVVPLAEVTDPRIGLGFPATFRSSDRTITAAPISGRDRALLRLAQTATAGGGDEIVLDDALIDHITADSTHPDASAHAAAAGHRLRVPPHIEIALQIHAADLAALREDRYRLLVRGGSRAAGTTTGRFLGLLDEPDLARFRAAYTGLATVREDAVAVQLPIPPLRATSTHLAAAPPLLPEVLSIGEVTDQTGALRAGDLAVSADVDGMALVHLPDGRVIEPTVCNAVEFRSFSHPLARYLCELPRTRTAAYMPFSWGTAASLAFLPRVRFERTVLAPARWNLTATDLTADLPTGAASWPAWQDGLAAWRDRFRVPDRVQLVDIDNLLPLDLTVDLHRRLLRSHLDRTGHARLEESWAPQDFGWLHGHAHEITIALTASSTATSKASAAGRARPAAATHCRGPVPISAGEPRIEAGAPTVAVGSSESAGHLPGAGRWVSARLYTAPDATSELVERVPDLLAGWEGALDWWYLPYRDPDPHLRLRIRLADRNGWGEAITRVGGWAARLQQLGLHNGLVLDTYRPETGRYGHDEAMTAAERVFAADSAAAMIELAAAHTGLPLEAIAAASAVDILTAAHPDTSSGMRWAIEHLPHQPDPLPRPLYTLAARVADPTGEWAALRATDTSPHVAGMLGTWRRRAAAIGEYRDVLAAQRDPGSVTGALLHLHAVRLFGIDPARERRARRLTRAAALRWTALHTSDHTKPPCTEPALSTRRSP